MSRARKFRVNPDWDGDLNEISMSEVGMLLWVKLREQNGEAPPTRETFLEELPIKERTIDGNLSKLMKSGHLQAV